MSSISEHSPSMMINNNYILIFADFLIVFQKELEILSRKELKIGIRQTYYDKKTKHQNS